MYLFVINRPSSLTILKYPRCSMVLEYLPIYMWVIFGVNVGTFHTWNIWDIVLWFNWKHENIHRQKIESEESQEAYGSEQMCYLTSRRVMAKQKKHRACWSKTPWAVREHGGSSPSFSLRFRVPSIEDVSTGMFPNNHHYSIKRNQTMRDCGTQTT